MKDVFLTVAEISLSTSVIILILLLISKGLNKRYLAKWKYFIWIALALRLAVPVKLELPQKEIVFEVPARVSAPIVSNVTPVGTAVPFVPQVQQAPSISALDVIAVVWLVGCVLFLLAHIGSYFVYRRQILVGGERVRDAELLRVIRGLSKELGIHDRIPALTYSGASSPMVLGFFRPILILPEMDYREEELGFILRHELIHLKRRDTFFKLLFVLANAIHWFNPVIYLMRREAVVDMELSCDETVVQGGGYDTRKAYTETLLSTLCRQYQKSTNLSTQFYGGKQVMKLRFKNLLSRGKKKNGILILVIVLSAVVILGAVIGVSVSSGDNMEEAARMLEIADSFCNAYAKGDLDTMRLYLADSYEGDLEIEEVTDLEGHIALKGNPMPGDLSVYAEDPLSVTSTNAPVGSTFSACAHRSDIRKPVDALWLRFIKQEDGWKIQKYALTDYQNVNIAESVEGLSHREAAAEVALQVAIARFNNDLDAMHPYLSYRWEGMIWDVTFDQFPDVSKLKAVEVQGPNDISLSSEHIPLGSTTTMAIEVNDVHESDTFIVRLIRQENGWRAYDFGFEKMDGFGRAAAQNTDPAAAVTEETQWRDSELTDLKAVLSVSYQFAEACLRGDTAAMKPLLADSFTGTLQTYQSPGFSVNNPLPDGIMNSEIYHLISSDPDNMYQSDISIGCVVSLAMKLNTAGDELILSLVKQEEGWKVYKYGLAEPASEEVASDDERSEMERIERLLLQNGLEHYAYMILDEAPEELKPVILEARHRIILNSDWVDDEQDAWVLDEDGNKEEVPHFSEVFPEDWEIPVEEMTEEEKLAHSHLQTLIDPERAELMAMLQTTLGFTQAYFGDDPKAVGPYLAYSYLREKVYEGTDIKLGNMTGKISLTSVPGDLSQNINDELSVYSQFIPAGSRMTTAVDLSEFGAEPGHERMEVCLVKMEDGWKVADCGFIPQGPIATRSDERQIEALVKAFADDFFAGKSAKDLRGYLSTPYDTFSDQFADQRGFLSIANYRLLPRAGVMLPADGYVPVVVDFYTQESPDAYRYLELKLVKEGDDWKIYSYIVDV